MPNSKHMAPRWQPFWLLAESSFHWGFIRQEQVTDNSMKGAGVKTQASTGEKSIRVEALGRKGGMKAHPDIEETHDWWVCVCVLVTHDHWDELKLMDREELGGKTLIPRCNHSTVKQIWFDLFLRGLFPGKTGMNQTKLPLIPWLSTILDSSTADPH